MPADRHHHHHHHHQFLLLLVEHRASMKSFQALRSPTIPLTSFHYLPVFLISSSIVLHHVLISLPLLLYPWGFQSNAVFSIAPPPLCNVCPIQFHFLLFIWISIGFCLVILHSSSFVILSVHFIFIIRLKHLFINVCNLLVIWLVVFQVSQAYNNTDFTFVLNIHILTPFDINASRWQMGFNFAFKRVNTVLTGNWLPVGNIYISVHGVSSQKTSL